MRFFVILLLFTLSWAAASAQDMRGHQSWLPVHLILASENPSASFYLHDPRSPQKSPDYSRHFVTDTFDARLSFLGEGEVEVRLADPVVLERSLDATFQKTLGHVIHSFQFEYPFEKQLALLGQLQSGSYISIYDDVDESIRRVIDRVDRGDTDGLIRDLYHNPRLVPQLYELKSVEFYSNIEQLAPDRWIRPNSFSLTADPVAEGSAENPSVNRTTLMLGDVKTLYPPDSPLIEKFVSVMARVHERHQFLGRTGWIEALKPQEHRKMYFSQANPVVLPFSNQRSCSRIFGL